MYDTLVQYDNGEIGIYGAAGLLGLSLVPGGRAGAKGLKATYTVYHGIDGTGAVKYIGITRRNPADRFAEHSRAYGTGKENLNYIPYDDTGSLSRRDARVYEQRMINEYGLENLYNRINSIAPSKWGDYGL